MQVIFQAINNTTGTRSKPMASDLAEIATKMAESPELLEAIDEYGILIVMDDALTPGELEISQAPFMLASTFIQTFKKVG